MNTTAKRILLNIGIGAGLYFVANRMFHKKPARDAFRMALISGAIGSIIAETRISSTDGHTAGEMLKAKALALESTFQELTHPLS